MAEHACPACDIRTTARNGPVVAIVAVHETDGIVFVSAQGMIVRQIILQAIRSLAIAGGLIFAAARGCRA